MGVGKRREKRGYFSGNSVLLARYRLGLESKESLAEAAPRYGSCLALRAEILELKKVRIFGRPLYY